MSNKPIPLALGFEEPYFTGLDRREVVLQVDEQTGTFVHPPMLNAPSWLRDGQLTWRSLGPEVEGTVYSFTVVHRAFTPGFAEDVPYVVAVCDVDGAPGARITGVVKSDEELVEIGTRVRLGFDLRDDVRVPVWSLS